MNLKWVKEIKPLLERQEFLSGMLELAEQNGIRSYEWWLEETED